jgi:magnesium/cobalt transport protein CorA
VLYSTEDGNITYERFKTALETMGIRCADDAAFLKLVDSIDKQSTHNISFSAFEAAVQKLKLVHLFEDPTVQRLVPQVYQPATITVTDFSNTKIQSFTLKQSDLAAFFTTTRSPWVSVRWININGHDSLNLKRLAIKYRLHPLAIEDTLEMHERPKFDRYEGHVFLVFPVLRMEIMQKKRSTTIKKRRARSHSVYTSLKPEAPHEDVENCEDPFRLCIEHVAIFIVGNKTVITVKNGDLSHIWDELNRRLTIPYSKLRHNDAKFLMYAVLDVIVDQITSVVDTITESLMDLEDELDTLKSNFDAGKLRFLKNELFRLPRLLKPAREVLKYLIESKDFDEVVTAYIRDVHDHTVQVLDDIELQLQMCRLLTEDYRDAKANQMNYVIYTLTIVTTVFLPAQFLTGVYGMNFDNMPELHTQYGYYLFWIGVLGIAIGLQCYFRYKKWV